MYCVLKVIRSRVKMGGAELALMLFAILYVRGVSALDECFIEDFNGSLGIMDQSCGSAEKFPVSNYDGNEDEVFMRPENSNGYFVYPKSNTIYCMSSETLYLPQGSEIYIYMYIKNPTTNNPLLLVQFGTGFLSVSLVDTQKWNYYRLSVTSATTSNILIRYSDNVPDIFAAIDHIKILPFGAADCDITTSTSTTPTGTASTTESVTTPTGTASTTESVTTPTGTASTTESITTPTDIVSTTESPTTPTYISTTPTVTPPPVPPVIVIPDFKSWKIISIVGLSVAVFALLYSVMVTTYLCATKNQVNRNTPGQSIHKKTDKRDVTISNNANSIPRLQIISKGQNNGGAYYGITRKEL